MKKNLNKEEWIDETLHSLDPVEKQDPPPFLLTRLHAIIRNKQENGLIGKILIFLNRPAVALGMLALIIAVNGFVIISNMRSKTPDATTAVNHYRDDFSSTLVSVYDFENSEP